MISNIVVTPMGQGEFIVTYHTTVNNVSAVTVNYGADASYGSSAGGQAVSNAAGGSDCTVAMIPGLSSFHFQCCVVDADSGSQDLSTDQVYPAVVATQDPTPGISTPTATGVTITWNSSASGVGAVNYNVDGNSTIMQEAEAASTTSHSVSLSDLLGATKYDFTYQTDFDDPTQPLAVSAEFNFSTAADTGPGDPPGRLGISVSPSRIAVGKTSSVTAILVKRDGSPVAGVPIAFSLGDGQAQGSLSISNGSTDASGKCVTIFTASGIGAKPLKARRFVVVVAGTGSQTKRHRALIIVTAK